MSLNFGFNYTHPATEISFKFIPKILLSKECIHFLGQSVYTEMPTEKIQKLSRHVYYRGTLCVLLENLQQDAWVGA
jgi:hypothetical protein